MSDLEGALDRHWHLATDDHEVALAEFEYSVMRAFEGFARWQAECLAAVTGLQMGGGDNAILHVIRMKDRPKGAKEIARLLNRDDLPNIQYSLRKLVKAGLITKRGGGSHRQGVRYETTAQGRAVTERYAAVRRALLVAFTRSAGGLDAALEDATRTLELMAGIYEQAARIAATHRRPTTDRKDSGSA
ncbi:MAG: winged helix DNA-binding protein [Rhodothalassiaceae bacterium]